HRRGALLGAAARVGRILLVAPQMRRDQAGIIAVVVGAPDTDIVRGGRGGGGLGLLGGALFGRRLAAAALFRRRGMPHRLGPLRLRLLLLLMLLRLRLLLLARHLRDAGRRGGTNHDFDRDDLLADARERRRLL